MPWIWGVPENGGYPNSWMICFMENPKMKWMRTGGTPISGNLHMWLWLAVAQNWVYGLWYLISIGYLVCPWLLYLNRSSAHHGSWISIRVPFPFRSQRLHWQHLFGSAWRLLCQKGPKSEVMLRQTGKPMVNPKAGLPSPISPDDIYHPKMRALLLSEIPQQTTRGNIE